jgi:threonine dehydratase
VSKYVDDIVTVSNGQVCNEILKLYEEEGIIAEPAGVLSICGLQTIDPGKLKGKLVVCVLSGGNNDVSRYPEIIEKSLVYQKLRHYFIIEMTQNPGKLKNFIKHTLGPTDDIIRFEYIKKTNMQYGNILLGIQLSEQIHINDIMKAMNDYGYKYTKITEDELIYKFII